MFTFVLSVIKTSIVLKQKLFLESCGSYFIEEEHMSVISDKTYTQKVAFVNIGT